MTNSTENFEIKTCENCRRKFTSEQDYLENTNRWRICDRKNLWFNCQCGSTLMIPKGKFSWYSPEKTMAPQAASLFNRLGGLQELPHIPMSVMEIQESLSKPDVDIPALAMQVRHDPLLAAGLLESANSIKSSREPMDRRKIDSIEHAIMYIGKKSFGELVTTISLKNISLATKVFQPEKFWRESFLVGELAEQIAKKWGLNMGPDEVYLSGCLCNVGKIVAALVNPEGVDKIEAMINDPKRLCQWPQAEALLKLPSHIILGEIGGALWGLPKYVLENISAHHGNTSLLTSKPDIRLPRTALSLWECVALANQLSHWILLRPSRMDQQLVDTITQSVGISSHDLELFVETQSHLGKKALSA